ncbi:hypothetical protein L489_5524 [Bordetella bronchiseptica 00-P-2730]|uniref:hypothetical protein n=1 Tax=Bordetella bronchiseptica TaxID=518 RepID=UPI00045B53DC|nr:hypothetical protein [Bordetella bronchiseptica]KCV34989.1 hypothetical protein L489_5524 [Bordetella bronchiseptica 00-P-2730]KCV59267.1 hypothetical protein L493_3811 [Bordetella bronchiseptica 99-R-0433]
MILIVPLFFAYLAMFAVVGIKAKRMGRSALWWLFLSLVLTPIITFIMLRGDQVKARRIQEKADSLKN